MTFIVGVLALVLGVGYAVCGGLDGNSSDLRWGTGIAAVGLLLIWI